MVLTTPLLVGLDGEQKMSKSLGNYVGIAEPPAEQFGKVMSIPDAQMPNYFQYATDWTPEQIADVLGKLVSGELQPNEAKRTLARTVVDLYHGAGRGGRGRGRVRPGLQGPRRSRGRARDARRARRRRGAQALRVAGAARARGIPTGRRAGRSRRARSSSRECPRPTTGSTPPPSSTGGRSRTGSGSGPGCARSRPSPGWFDSRARSR